MPLHFKKYAEDGNQFLKTLAKELGFPEDTDRAGRVLRAVLHTLRNQLTTEESVQLLAQLPMFLKAVYVEGWTLRKKEDKVKHFRDFYREIRKQDKQAATTDFSKDEDIDHAVVVTFMVLRKYISLGELEDIKAVLPKELKTYLNTATMI